MYTYITYTHNMYTHDVRVLTLAPATSNGVNVMKGPAPLPDTFMRSFSKAKPSGSVLQGRKQINKHIPHEYIEQVLQNMFLVSD